jgi:hypothetical protein
LVAAVRPRCDPQKGYPSRFPPERVYHAARRSVTTGVARSRRVCRSSPLTPGSRTGSTGPHPGRHSWCRSSRWRRDCPSRDPERTRRSDRRLRTPRCRWSWEARQLTGRRAAGSVQRLPEAPSGPAGQEGPAALAARATRDRPAPRGAWNAVSRVVSASSRRSGGDRAAGERPAQRAPGSRPSGRLAVRTKLLPRGGPLTSD